jgi:hypothetical protein
MEEISLTTLLELLINEQKVSQIEEMYGVNARVTEIINTHDVSRLSELQLQFVLAASLIMPEYIRYDLKLRVRLADHLVAVYPQNKLNHYLQFRATILSSELVGKAPVKSLDYALKLYPYISNSLVADLFIIWSIDQVKLSKEDKVKLLQSSVLKLEMQLDMLKGEELLSTVEVVKNCYYFQGDFGQVLYFSRRYGHYDINFITAVRKMEGKEVAFEESLNHGFIQRGNARVDMILDGTLTENERRESIEVLLAGTYNKPVQFALVPTEPNILPFLER